MFGRPTRWQPGDLWNLRGSAHRPGCTRPTFLAGWLLWTFLVAASGSAQPSDRVIDIPIQKASYGTDFFDETARQFASLRPGFSVRITGDFRVDEKVRVRVMTGDVPDATDAVLLYDALIRAGKIRNLAPYLDGPNWDETGRWRDDFLPGVLDRWRRPDGAVYGMPFAYAIWTLFYNQSLFAAHGWAPPKTWDDFFALCDKAKAQGIAPLTLPGVYMRYGDAFLQAAYYNLVGPETYGAYNELQPGTRVDPRFIRAAGVVQRITTGNLIHGWEGMTHTAAQQAFLEGRSAMNLSASWFVSEMRGKIPEGFQLGVSNLPVFADGITDPNTLQSRSAYYFLFVTGDPEREKATVDFFRYLTSRERVRAFARQIESPVALRTVGPDDYANPVLKQLASMMAKAPATFDAAPPASASFLALLNQAMTDARYRLMIGQMTPQQFGERLEAMATAERGRAGEPLKVEYRHPWAAGLLGVAVLLPLAWAWLSRWRRSQAGQRSAKPPAGGDGFLGPMRAGFAATFVAPAWILFALFTLAPSVAALLWAFLRWDGFTGKNWVGTFNFRWLLFESDTFWFALRNNLYLMVVPTLLVVPTALLLASLIHRGVWGAGFFRAVFLFPNLLGGIAATLLWMNAYDPNNGLVNALLVHLGEWLGSGWLQSFRGYAWLSQANLYRALIPIYLWMACGFNLVLYLAAMEGINPELYEAAEIDGAPVWRQFFTITVPLIWDVLAMSAVFIVIAGLNTFEMIWLLTSQDPVSGSHVLSTLMVSTMFREFQVGRATAVAVIMFLIVLSGSALVLRVMKSRGANGGEA